jgi:uncharacterized membrane protein YfcA
MVFPISGVEISPIIPPLVAFIVSFFTSMGGVSGAFLLLPFQVSILGFTSPAVSPTNLVFNIVAIPSGIYRYLKEGRMAWPLTWVVVIGALPGVAIGGVIRVRYLPDPGAFKFFVGLVLLYMGLRLLWDLTGGRASQAGGREAEQRFNKCLRAIRKSGADDGNQHYLRVRTLEFSLHRISYSFYGETFSFSTWGVFSMAFIVGIVGGDVRHWRGGDHRPVFRGRIQTAGVYRGRASLGRHFYYIGFRCNFLSVYCSGIRAPGNGRDPGLAFGDIIRDRRPCRYVLRRPHSKICTCRVYKGYARIHHHSFSLEIHLAVCLDVIGLYCYQ